MPEEEYYQRKMTGVKMDLNGWILHSTKQNKKIGTKLEKIRKHETKNGNKVKEREKER